MGRKLYFFYILLGVLYPVVKVIYYVNDLVCGRAVIYGLIAGILSICAAIAAFREYKGAGKPIGHWLAALIPLLIIPLTPIIMIIHLGSAISQIEKIMVLIIFGGLAIVQFVLAILMFRGLIFKRGEDRLIMPNIGFMIMKTVLRARNIFRKPERTLHEMGLQKGQAVLDYGCGIGSFAIPASKMVGNNGVVYALDIHPLATKTVEKEARKRGISNIKTILADRDTGLPNGSVDIVLLYDVLQMIRGKEGLLRELHRVLKSGGSLFATAEHTEMSGFMNVFTKANLFSLIGQVGKLFNFQKN